MIKKVLIAEDFDSINLSVIHTLNQLGITEVEHVKYCDDAILKLKKSIVDNTPFDLFITDLSFEKDHRKTIVESGEEVIAIIRSLMPELKIIVYSVEDRNLKIKNLFEKFKINAYVHKGRNSIEGLKAAINFLIDKNEIFYSPETQNILRNKDTHQIDEIDIQIIKQLSNGVKQDDLEARLKELGIKASSKSSIEKRLSKLKDSFRANNPTHLIAIAKDLGII